MSEPFAQFLDSWVSYLGATGLEEWRQEVPAPWAGLSVGAAGHAYALWYIATRRGQPEPLAGARRWSRFAVRSAERRSGFYGKDLEKWRVGGSVSFGRPGLHLIEGLIAHAQQKSRARDAAFARFDRALRTARQPYAEHNFGLAGALAAALGAHRVTGSPALRVLADHLAERLLAAPEIEVGSFAHGRVGVQHALLAWAQQTGGALPAAFAEQIVRPSDEEIIARDARFAGSWCNGITGFIFLWTKAYEVTRDEQWRTRAVGAARRLIRQQFTRNTSLCCGRGGQAYAMLAVSRIDDGEPWRTHASDHCISALQEAPPHGLSKGLSGLACLAADLSTPGDARFPLAEP